MAKLISIIGNVALYAFLLWLLWDTTIHEWDPWFAFTVGFVLVLAVIISLMPSVRAPSLSPGTYPYDD